VAVFVFGRLVVTNVALVVFNLVPTFPMDGGRIFRALLARTRSYESATRSAARLGTGFAVLFAVVVVLSFAPMLVLLSLFIYGAASSESRTVALQGLLADTTVRDVATLEVDPVVADATVSELTDRMVRDRRTVYPVSDGGEVVGAVTLDAVRRSKADGSASVRSILLDDLPRVSLDVDAFEAFVQVSGHRSGIALVEVDGRATGTISLEDFTQLLQFRREGVGVEPKAAL
jgi:CBS domain-containing protein